MTVESAGAGGGGLALLVDAFSDSGHARSLSNAANNWINVLVRGITNPFGMYSGLVYSPYSELKSARVAGDFMVMSYIAGGVVGLPAKLFPPTFAADLVRLRLR